MAEQVNFIELTINALNSGGASTSPSAASGAVSASVPAAQDTVTVGKPPAAIAAPDHEASNVGDPDRVFNDIEARTRERRERIRRRMAAEREQQRQAGGLSNITPTPRPQPAPAADTAPDTGGSLEMWRHLADDVDKTTTATVIKELDNISLGHTRVLFLSSLPDEMAKPLVAEWLSRVFTIPMMVNTVFSPALGRNVYTIDVDAVGDVEGVIGALSKDIPAHVKLFTGTPGQDIANIFDTRVFTPIDVAAPTVEAVGSAETVGGGDDSKADSTDSSDNVAVESEDSDIRADDTEHNELPATAAPQREKQESSIDTDSGGYIVGGDNDDNDTKKTSSPTQLSKKLVAAIAGAAGLVIVAAITVTAIIVGGHHNEKPQLPEPTRVTTGNNATSDAHNHYKIGSSLSVVSDGQVLNVKIVQFTAGGAIAVDGNNNKFFVSQAQLDDYAAKHPDRIQNPL